MFVFFQSRRFLAVLVLVGAVFYFKSRYERQVVQLHQSTRLLQNLVLHDLAYQIDILNVMLRIISEASVATSAGSSVGPTTVTVECDRLRAELLALRESAKGHGKHGAASTPGPNDLMRRLTALRSEIEAFVKKNPVGGDLRVRLEAQQKRLQENMRALETRKKTSDEMNAKFDSRSRMPLFKLFAP